MYGYFSRIFWMFPKNKSQNIKIMWHTLAFSLQGAAHEVLLTSYRYSCQTVQCILLKLDILLVHLVVNKRTKAFSFIASQKNFIDDGFQT